MSAPRRKRVPVDGVLLLDKPLGVSSNGALQKVRWLYNAAKAGHTGVLDPLATGLLPVCFGEATKFSSYLLDADKGYRATIQFGAVTSTGDVEGEVLCRREVTHDRERLEAAMQGFLGEIDQVPPMYSALKHQGRALYEYAREGVEIERAARRVTIHRFTLLECGPDTAVVDVLCSKGTYIRTLAQDLGEALGCGAHLTGLRRTTTGGFRLEDAHTVETIEALPETERAGLLLPVDVLVGHLPALSLDEGEAFKFSQGQAVRISQNCETMPRFRVYRNGGRDFMGLGEVCGDKLQPIRLLATKAAVSEA